MQAANMISTAFSSSHQPQVHLAATNKYIMASSSPSRHQIPKNRNPLSNLSARSSISSLFNLNFSNFGSVMIFGGSIVQFKSMRSMGTISFITRRSKTRTLTRNCFLTPTPKKKKSRHPFVPKFYLDSTFIISKINEAHATIYCCFNQNTPIKGKPSCGDLTNFLSIVEHAGQRNSFTFANSRVFKEVGMLGIP